MTVSDRALLSTEAGSGWVEGYGVPGDLAWEMAADAKWLRRLYVTSDTGDLVQTTTPAGHTCDSTAPPADRDPRPARRMGWRVDRLTLAS